MNTYKRIFNITRNNNSIFTFTLSLFLTVFYLYQDFSKWQIINFINAQGPIIYVDTHTVLLYADCFAQIGNAVFDEGSNCAGWMYGTGILRTLNFIGATHEYVALIGHFFTYSIICTFIYYLYLARNNKLAQSALFLGFMSPPIWLIMERANFDTLIYLMVLVSAILLINKHEMLSIFCLFLSATFKFYTLPLLIIPFILSKNFKTKFISVLSLFMGATLVLLDFNRMTGVIIQAGNNHFGMKIVGNYLGKIGIHLNNYNSYFLGAVLFSICIIFFFYILRKVEPFVFQKQLFFEPMRTVFIFMSSTFLLCFVAGLSVDYRLIFYIASAPFLISILRSNLRYFTFGVFIIGCWLSYPSGVFQTIGDLALELVASLLLIVTLLVIFSRKNNANFLGTLDKFSFLKSR